MNERFSFFFLSAQTTHTCTYSDTEQISGLSGFLGWRHGDVIEGVMSRIAEVVMEVGLTPDCLSTAQHSCRSICSLLQRPVPMVGDVWFLGGPSTTTTTAACTGQIHDGSVWLTCFESWMAHRMV